MLALVRITMLVATISILVASCFKGRSAPEPAATSLTVHNRSSFDVNVFAIPSPMVRPNRLGTVTSGSTVTFTLQTRDLQPGGFLAVQVHAIGARGSWVSDAVPVSSDDLAVLDVYADSFGDCSTSSLYTAWKPETAGVRAIPALGVAQRALLVSGSRSAWLP